MKRNLLLILVALLPMVTSAYDAKIDGICYNFIGDEAEVTSDNPSSYSRTVVIPEIIGYNGKTYNVTSIGEDAFFDCKDLTSITIPNSLRHIGYGAFYGCKALTAVHIKDLETWCKISFDDRYANPLYYAKHLYLNGQEIKDLIIPQSINTIGQYSFCYCYSLNSITIHSEVTSIGLWAFARCESLKDVYCYAANVPEGRPFDSPSLLKSATLHVPAGSVERYKAASPWSEFGNIVALEEIAQEYFPEGTKWTEIRLDTLKYDSWYSKIGDEWVPNFETIEYRVQGEYSDKSDVYKKVYTNGPEWTDSLAFLLFENGHNVETTVIVDNYVMWPGETYQFDWSVGKGLYYRDIMESNSTGEYPYYFFFGVIDEIKEGDFGGVRPLKYVDLDGKAPDNTYKDWDWGYTDARGGRIIQGIGITEWNDGECLFGPPNPYFALGGSYGMRHYRSMLVHFERDGEVLYDVWPEKKAVEEPVTFTAGQVATIILPTAPDAGKGKYYRLDRCEEGQIIFEQEKQPQAHIPYIIVPSEDFSIDTSTLDLAGLSPDTVSIGGIHFIGSYSRNEPVCQEGWYIDIIDTTPDCKAEEGKVYTIGALRAYLTVNWDDPINHEGTKGPEEKLEIVLHDNGTGIDRPTPDPSRNGGEVYDLQGRKLSGKPARGIYLMNGKLTVIK